MSDWRQIIDDAKARIDNPSTRLKLAGLMERGVELSLQKAAGVDVDQDLAILAATAAGFSSAEVAIAAQAIEAAAWAEVRKIIWTGLFGLAVP